VLPATKSGEIKIKSTKKNLRKEAFRNHLNPFFKEPNDFWKILYRDANRPQSQCGYSDNGEWKGNKNNSRPLAYFSIR
jgi:hypothetical protein